MIAGLALLLHLQLGLTRIANFGVVGFWGIGMYAFGVLYAQLDWPFSDPWLFLVCAAAATLVAGLAGLLVGWLISDLDTDGVLVVTLGFATVVQILATTEQDDHRRRIRPGRAPHPVRHRQGQGQRVRLARDHRPGRRRDLPLRLAGPPIAVRAPPDRRGQQRAAGSQPGEVDLPHQALAVRGHVGSDGPAWRDGCRHGAVPRCRPHRDRHHPRGDRRAGAGRDRPGLGRGRGRRPDGGPVRHRRAVLPAPAQGVVLPGNPRPAGGGVRADADPRPACSGRWACSGTCGETS